MKRTDKVVKSPQGKKSKPRLSASATAHAESKSERVRQAHTNSELRYQRLFETAQDGILILDAKTRAITEINPFLIKMLGESEEHYRSLFENMLNGFAYCKMLFEHERPQDFIYLDVNSAFETLTGLKNVVGKKVSEVIPGIRESDPELFEIYGRVALTGIPERFETYVEALGMWFWISVYSPKKEYFVAVFDVITERKRAAEALAQSEKKYRALVENALVGVYMTNIKGEILYMNETAFRMFGFNSIDEMLSGSAVALYKNPEDRRVLIENLLKTGNVRNFEFEALTKAGETRSIMLCAALSGDVLTGMVLDVSERKKTEEAIKESRKKYQQLYDEAPVGYQELDCKGTIVQVNKTEADMLGYTIHDMLGKSIFDFIAPEEREAAKKRFRQRIKEQQSTKEFERKYMRKNGEAIYFYIIDRSVTDNEGKIIGIRSTLQDITERKRAEEARIRLETAIEHAGDIVIITDTEGNIQYVNSAFERITGFTREEAIGKTPRMLKSGKHDEVFYKTLWDTLLSGKTWKGHLINRKKDESIFEEETSISPIKNSAGNITNFVAVKRDVTNEILMEQRFLESQKMEAIGTLAGGIAHDFNNILSAIIGYTELSMDQVSKETQLHSDLEKINIAGCRARDLVNQILTFSRQREQEKSPIHITPIIKESLNFLKASLPSNIEIRENIEPESGTVLADPTQIHQIVMNLCTNAGNAMLEKGGILEVSLNNVELDSDFALRHPGIMPGPHLKIMVSDSGHGMEPEVMKRIFEPYFTTKAKSGGTGLGLAVVHGIVTGYNGAITVYSEPGKGSAFNIYLPVTAEKPVTGVVKEESILTGSERILIVDDEQDMVFVGKRNLESLGYTVKTSTSSMETLKLFQENPGQFDLVITDMTMPFMSGDELAGELMSIRPDIPVIICTGYSVKINEEKAMTSGFRAYLVKPLYKSVLAETVRRVLDQHRGGK